MHEVRHLENKHLVFCCPSGGTEEPKETAVSPVYFDPVAAIWCHSLPHPLPICPEESVAAVSELWEESEQVKPASSWLSGLPFQKSIISCVFSNYCLAVEKFYHFQNVAASVSFSILVDVRCFNGSTLTFSWLSGSPLKWARAINRRRYCQSTRCSLVSFPHLPVCTLPFLLLI